MKPTNHPKAWEQSVIGLMSAILLGVAPAHGAIHYVTVSNATPVAPFSTWADAATNVESALAVSEDGDQVVISNGFYDLVGSLVITNAVTVSGMNGAEVTVIDGTQTSRCFEVRNTGARLTGLTIQNGFSPDGGGGVYMISGVVDRCCIRSNAAIYSGGGIRVVQGSVRLCSIEHNRVSGYYVPHIGYSAGHGGGLYLVNATADQCRVFGNEGLTNADGGGVTVYGGELRNSLIYSNSVVNGEYLSHHYSGGGGVCIIVSGAVINCTIVFNSAQADYEGGLHILAFTGMYPVVKNTIIWSNTGQVANRPDGWLANWTAMNNCSDPLLPGPGNISVNPGLLWSGADPFALGAGSPCIDAGAATPPGDRDFAGVPRPLDGDHNGVTRADIGAMEFVDAAADSDADGIGDAEEIQVWLSNPTAADTDMDGCNDLGERIAGTGLCDAQSFLAVAETVFAGPVVEIRWIGVTGRLYDVMATTNYSAPWLAVAYATNIPGSGGFIAYTNPLSGGSRGYAIRARIGP